MLQLTPGRDFRLIWSAGIVSQLGDWSARLALVLLVLERGGGAATVGVVALLFVLPWLGIGQLLTGWSARFGRRPVLIGCDAFRGIAFLAIGTLDLSTPVVLVVVGFAALADPVFEATKATLVTETVSKEQYAGAIQVMHVADQAASLAGYAMGGVLVGLVGATSTLNLNGVSFLLSALLITAVSRPAKRTSDADAKPSLTAALRFLRSDPISGVGFLATMIVVAAGMSVESQAAVYGKAVAGLTDQGVGLLAAVTPAATLVAVALLKTSEDDRMLLRQGLLTAAAAAGSASALLFLGVEGIAAFVPFALVGVSFSFATMTNVVVGRRLPPENRVSIFSILQTGVFLGLSLGSLVGGVISEATSPEVAAGAALAVGATCTLAAIPYASERRHQRPLPTEVPEE